MLLLNTANLPLPQSEKVLRQMNTGASSGKSHSLALKWQGEDMSWTPAASATAVGDGAHGPPLFRASQLMLCWNVVSVARASDFLNQESKIFVVSPDS